MLLAGKKVVVIGASGHGIGLATAQAVAAQGAQVVIASRSREKLEQAKKLISGRAEVMPLDMTNEVEVEHFFEQVGVFDHLVVTASSTAPDGPFLSGNGETARRNFEKFWGQVYASRAAARRIAKDGSLILFSSAAAKKLPSNGGAMLASTNAAIATLGVALSLELSPIRVNIIAPSWVENEEQSEQERMDLSRWALESLPTKRLGRAEDVAQGVIYLMTNSYTTGVLLPIDGGLSVT